MAQLHSHFLPPSQDLTGLGVELRHVQLSAALRSLARSRVAAPLDRRLAYRANGLGSVSDAEDREAMRRAFARLDAQACASVS